MNRYRLAALAALFLCLLAGAQENTRPTMPGLAIKDLMTAPITPEKVISRWEIKEVTLEPMRTVRLHLHPIPAVSVILEGAIAFQIEGQPVQHLRAGDVCLEPANERISHFDNERDTPAKFAVFYMLGKDDHELVQLLAQNVLPGPTRKDLLTATVAPEKTISRVEIRELILEPERKGPLHLHPIPVLTVVREGAITFQIEGQPAQHLKAGDVFYEPANVRIAHLDNELATPAKLVVLFMLGKDDHETVKRLAE